MPDSIIEGWDDFRFEIVPVEKLFVDKEYQRRLTSLAEEIATSFSPLLVQTLCVSARRETGRGGSRRVAEGAVFDGQTRLAGSNLRNRLLREGRVEGKAVPGLPCLVYSGLDQSLEAELFSTLQQKRRGIMSYDRFRAQLVARKPESLAIADLVDNAGYEVGYTGMSSRTISAVGALEQMYRRDPAVLDRALVVFREAWRDNYVPNSYQLRGMERFLRDNPDADDERLVRRLFLTSPDDLEKKAINARELSGGKRSVADMAAAIKSVYSMRESVVDRRVRAVS